MKYLKPKSVYRFIPTDERMEKDINPYNNDELLYPYRIDEGIYPYVIPIFGAMYFNRIKFIIKLFSKMERKFHKMLDVGGGFGLFSYNYKINFPNSEVYLTEIKNLNLISRITCKLGINLKEIVYCDLLQRIPYDDDKFDLIFVLDVLEHLTDPDRALDEILRVLKKKGLLFISVPKESRSLIILRKLIGKVFAIDTNPHWLGLIKSEEEFKNCLKNKRVKILLERVYPFQMIAKLFSYDVFYLLKKL